MSPTATTSTVPGRRGPAPPPPEIERAALLRAGIECIVDGGVARLTVSDVLAAAGLGTRAFYRHFPSKGAFLLAIWQGETDDGMARLRERMRGHDGIAAVDAWIADRLDRVFADRDDAVLRALWKDGFWLHNADPRGFRAVVNPPVALLRDALRDAVAAGLLGPHVDPVLDAATIHQTFWMLAERHFEGMAITRTAAVRHMARVTAGLFASVPTDDSRRD